MNDATFAQLEEIVERVLRPVWASRSRKQMLRMELLAHVIGVFEEEFATLDDEQAALNETLFRFGIAEAVASELQSSLTFRDRWLHFLFEENLMSAWWWYSGVLAIFTGPAFILPAMAKYKAGGVLQILPLVIGAAITLAGLAVVGYGIKRLLPIRSK
jgi:hypothetical protein